MVTYLQIAKFEATHADLESTKHTPIPVNGSHYTLRSGSFVVTLQQRICGKTIDVSRSFSLQTSMLFFNKNQSKLKFRQYETL